MGTGFIFDDPGNPDDDSPEWFPSLDIVSMDGPCPSILVKIVTDGQSAPTITGPFDANLYFPEDPDQPGAPNPPEAYGHFGPNSNDRQPPAEGGVPPQVLVYNTLRLADDARADEVWEAKWYTDLDDLIDPPPSRYELVQQVKKTRDVVEVESGIALIRGTVPAGEINADITVTNPGCNLPEVGFYGYLEPDDPLLGGDPTTFTQGALILDVDKDTVGILRPAVRQDSNGDCTLKIIGAGNCSYTDFVGEHNGVVTLGTLIRKKDQEGNVLLEVFMIGPFDMRSLPDFANSDAQVVLHQHGIVTLLCQADIILVKTNLFGHNGSADLELQDDGDCPEP